MIDHRITASPHHRITASPHHRITKYFSRLFLIFLFGVSSSYALPFNIVPQEPLPTQFLKGSTQTAVYTVTNNSSILLPNNYVAYFPSLHGKVNSSQVLNDATYPNLCGVQFTLNPGASCTLELLIEDTVQWSTNPKFNLMICASDTTTCAGPSAANALNVQSVAYSQLAYISSRSSGAISICGVEPADGTLALCYSFSDPSFYDPIDVILNEANTVAYVANSGDNILSICPVDQNGALSACVAYPNFDFTFAGLRLNPAGTYLYATAYFENAVTSCPVNMDGSLQACTNLYDFSGTFSKPSGRLAFNILGTYAYVPNFGNFTVSVCQTGNDGTFEPCDSPAFSDPSFYGLLGLDINAAGNAIYVANLGNTISMCPLPLLSSTPCTSLSGNDIHGNSTFNFSDNHAINLFTHATTGFAYIPNGGGNNISICPFNPDGTFGTCITSTQTFSEPDSIWIADFS